MILNPIILNFLPNGSDKEVSFDRADFIEIKAKAEATKGDIQSKREEVKQAIDKLRDKWKTPAGREFFKNLDDNWAADIDKFTRTMDAFIRVMDEVEVQFREIEGMVRELQNMGKYM